VAFVWNHLEIRMVMLMLAVIGMFGFSAHTVALPLFAFRDLHGDAGTLTFVLTGLSVGSLAGALASAHRGTVGIAFLARSAIAFGCFNAVLGLAPNALAAAALSVPVGYTVMVTVAGMNAMIQLQTPAHLRGRVMALVSVVLVGTSPVGGPVIGSIAEWRGAPAALAVGGVLAICAAAVTLRTLSSRLARTPA
jgi:MFS family permease